MARKGDIEIPVAVDTSGVEKSIQNGLIDPIEDAEKALKKLSDTDAGRDIDKAMDKAQDATEDLQKELESTRKDLDKLGYAAKGAGDDARRGMDRAKAGVEDFKTEANQTARESAASFSGSADDIADVFQEVAANAFAGFGPAGAAAGIAAAAGIGTVLSAINEQQEAVDALKEKFRDAYQSAAEDGRTFLNEAEIQSLAIEIFFDPAQRAAAQKDAEKLGVDLQTAVRAQAGDQDALAAVIAAGNEKIAEGTERMREKAEAGKNVIDYQTAETANLETLVGKYSGILQITKDNEQAAKDVQQLKRDMTDEEIAQIQRTRDADQARYEALAAKYANPVKATVQVDVDDSAARRALDALQRRAERGVTVPAGLGRTYE